MIVCTTCGTHNTDGDEFCARCGSFLEWVGEAVPADDPQDAEAEGEREGGRREAGTQGQRDRVGARRDSAFSEQQVPRFPPRPLPHFRAIKLGDTILCGQCGTDNGRSQKFCRRCGISLVLKPPPWWKRLFRRKQQAVEVRAPAVEEGPSPPPAMDALVLVERLLSQPSRLSELEAVVGSIHMSFRTEDYENTGSIYRPPLGEEEEFSQLIPHLSIEYAYDRYHERPTRQRDVKLIEYTLHLRGDRVAVERVLLARFGQPRHVSDRFEHTTGAVSTTEYAAYHPFYVTDGGLGDFILKWFAAVPRFAIPEPDAELRRAWLADLCARLEAAHSVDEIDAFCRAAPRSVGIEIGGTLNNRLNPVADFNFPLSDARDYWISFAPPVSAHAIIEAFRWAPAVGVSHDVHMSSWHIERRNARRRPISGALQHWEIEAHLAKWPSGPPEPDADPGPTRPYGIGDADEVTNLAIRPRFR